MSWLWLLLALPPLIWVLAVAYIFILQRRKMYPVERQPFSPPLVPGRSPRVVETRAADGIVCVHWYWPPSKPGGVDVVLFHGNGCGQRISKYWQLVLAGHGLLLCGYRGYNANPGRPSEQGILADARAALDWVAAQGKPPPAMFGESLGGAVAIAMAAEGRGSAIILEGPFDQAASVAAMRYPWIPVRRLILDRWDSIGRIRHVTQPLLWMHGGDDTVVPLPFGQRLYDAAPGPKQSLIVEGGGHIDYVERPEVMQVIVAFLDRLPHVAGQTRRDAFA